MLTLGISGGLDLIDENREYLFPPGCFHDAAAVLVDSGKVVAAIEEERLNRIKHTNKGAVSAIRFCLDSYGVSLRDLDYLAIYGDERLWSQTIKETYYSLIHIEPVSSLRELIHQMLDKGLQHDIDNEKIIFVPHHLSHAISAYVHSGYYHSLVLTIDGVGDDLAGTVMHGEANCLTPIHGISINKSIGAFYYHVIEFLGFGFSEEYKVMGLAPYGNPQVYRDLFRTFYTLLPDGDYIINWGFSEALSQIAPPRKKKQPLTKLHQDLAAALQEALETIVFHVLRYYQWMTNHRRLCMAGGVSHNCTLNGKILYSGLFEDVFVQPAAHDAGCAVGAALYPYVKYQYPWQSAVQPYHLNLASNGVNRNPIQHVYWGTNVGTSETILKTLEAWNDLLEYEDVDNIAERTAKLLAEGAVIGWVQDRSEFGPRALGNRSIVADPRLAENKEIINMMVKKREGFRPFAPAVLEEYAEEFFDLRGNSKNFSFMTFVVKVRQEKQSLLGATTHVDGTARIQTVSRETNSKFWELIEEFRLLTGIPILLNTSFNNNVEPIVDSANDAIICFLTTKLDCLVIGNYLIKKKGVNHKGYDDLIVSLPPYVKLVQMKNLNAEKKMIYLYEINNTYNDRYKVNISPDMHALLIKTDGVRTIRTLLQEIGLKQGEKDRVLVDELIGLWAQRVITLRPADLLSAGDS